jgi:ADP-L-glycero-D-manno-heptose 6-epimerase
MIIVTGGAGFIGSALIWKLNQRNVDDIVVVDHLGTDERWRNLVPLRYMDYYDSGEFIDKLERDYFGSSIDAIFHLGACSSTTENDAGFLIENNFRYTLRLALWWEKHPETRFIYASSAATYGDGSRGYMDDETKLHELRPLNMYGYSKHLFDCVAARRGWFEKIVGLKYFNVYGPNEYHKGEMRSLVNKSYVKIRDEGALSLFKSYRDGYADGEQKRDFIYIKDVLEMTLFFFDKKSTGGLFNVGSGNARTWNDLARAMFTAMNKPVRIDYIPMPEYLKPKYQYFTQANPAKLRKAGCNHSCLSLEEAVKEYILKYLAPNLVLGE